MCPSMVQPGIALAAAALADTGLNASPTAQSTAMKSLITRIGYVRTVKSSNDGCDCIATGRNDAYRSCIANGWIFARERALCRTKYPQNCEKALQSMQSHCRGQGFDSPQLHQPNQRLSRSHGRTSSSAARVRRRSARYGAEGLNSLAVFSCERAWVRVGGAA